MKSLEAIIPIKDRIEVERCVHSLINLANEVTTITLCDGGTTDPECVQILQKLEQQKLVRILDCPMEAFNKAKLLNQGIAQSKADLLLLSDADIIWNSTALEALLNQVLSSSHAICHSKNVEESDPSNLALRRKRYSYKIAIERDIITIDIVRESQSNDYERSGLGLLCARRTTLLALGGYKELFLGWGWEDHDLLIRAKICGLPVYADGKVIHLSHSDTLRNQHNGNLQPTFTRDRNIVACIQSLLKGVFLGDLPVDVTEQQKYKIQVRLPESLRCLN